MGNSFLFTLLKTGFMGLGVLASPSGGAPPLANCQPPSSEAPSVATPLKEAVHEVDRTYLRTVRRPPIETPPRYENHAPGKGRQYTDYEPAHDQRAAQEVLDRTANGSFISRMVRVITVDGKGKTFQDLTGLDGVTFGVAHVATDDGVYEFFRYFEKKHPGDLIEIFGKENAAHLLDRNWIVQENKSGRRAGADDRGLIRLPWFREGIDKLLQSPRYHKTQLEQFVHTKVNPSLRFFKKRKYGSEFLLAAMVSTANSWGVAGMKNQFDKVEKSFLASPAGKSLGGKKKELSLAGHFLAHYITSGGGSRERDQKVAQVLRESRWEDLPNHCEGLGHRAKRACEVAKKFPPVKAKAYRGKGHFSH